MSFTVTSEQILWFIGTITAIFSFYKILVEIKKPSNDLKNKVKEHDESISEVYKRMTENEQAMKMTLKSLLVIINHEITGNGVETMKETRDELQAYIIDK